jgi:hypothetical protein
MLYTSAFIFSVLGHDIYTRKDFGKLSICRLELCLFFLWQTLMHSTGQVIMIMFGIQLCPAAVKVAWTKVFPEDFNDEEPSGTLTSIEELKATAGGANNNNSSNRAVRGESIPVPIAFTCAKKAFEKAEKLMSTSRNKSATSLFPEQLSPQEQTSQNRGFKGILSDGYEEETTTTSITGGRLFSHKNVVEAAITAASKALQRDSIMKESEKTILTKQTSVKNASSNQDAMRATSAPPIISTLDTYDKDPSQSDYMSQTQSLSQVQSPLLAHHTVKSQPLSNTVIYKKLAEENPLFRTNLLPLDERPRNLPAHMTRQAPDAIDAKRVSPLLAQYLRISSESHTGDASTDAWVDDDEARLKKKSQPAIQKIRRTVPVSWCRVGGVNTYRRIANTLTNDHIEEITHKSEEAQKQFQRETIHSIIQRARTIEFINDKYHKVLASGTQKISRYVALLLTPHD